MKVSIIIPAYNEESTIREILKRVRAVNLDKEIIVVNDGSIDNTSKMIQKEKRKDIKIFTHEKNFGRGHAIRTGFKYVTGDIVIIQDADLEYEPQDYYKLIEPILNGKAAIVYGSRFYHGRQNTPILSYLANKFLTWLTNLLYRTKLTDLETALKVFKSSVIKGLRLTSTRFDFCPEITAKLIKHGYTICEVPITYRPRTRQEGKKIHWFDAIKIINVLIREKFKSV